MISFFNVVAVSLIYSASEIKCCLFTSEFQFQNFWLFFEIWSEMLYFFFSCSVVRWVTSSCPFNFGLPQTSWKLFLWWNVHFTINSNFWSEMLRKPVILGMFFTKNEQKECILIHQTWFTKRNSYVKEFWQKIESFWILRINFVQSKDISIICISGCEFISN